MSNTTLHRCALQGWHDLLLATQNARQNRHAVLIDIRVESIRYQLTGSVRNSDECCFFIDDIHDKEEHLLNEKKCAHEKTAVHITQNHAHYIYIE